MSSQSTVSLLLMAGAVMSPAIVAQGQAQDLAPSYGPPPVYATGELRSVNQDGTSVLFTNGPYVSNVGAGDLVPPGG